MFRFLLTASGAVVLAVALVFAVADIARSLAQDATATTTVAEALSSMGWTPPVGEGQPDASIDFAALVSAWPASVTLGAAAILLLFLGRRHRVTTRRTAR